MQRVISRRAAASTRGALVCGNLVAAAIRTLKRLAAIVRYIPLFSPACEPRDLSREVFKPVGDGDKILADQIKIVVVKVSV
jgi:hypothetical protein